MSDSGNILPYGRQSIDEGDIQAVVDVLQSDYLTTGPAVGRFEDNVASYCGVSHGVAVGNGTQALHLMLAAAGIGPGDEVIVPAITFVATANAAIYVGATPVIVDVDERLLIDPAAVQAAITERTKAVIAVDYAGQPCDYERLVTLCEERSIDLFSDACHALGATMERKPYLGKLRAACLSFHPVKHITTGEGGMIVSNDEGLVRQARRLRSHGIDRTAEEREAQQTHDYQMVDLGFNYRITDLQCALGLSQLKKAPVWLERRRALAARYGEAMQSLDLVEPLRCRDSSDHAYHLYAVRIRGGRRDEVFHALREEGILANVHYRPVHMHQFYRERFGERGGSCPVAEVAYSEILSLPMFPSMTDSDVDRVVRALQEIEGN